MVCTICTGPGQLRETAETASSQKNKNCLCTKILFFYRPLLFPPSPLSGTACVCSSPPMTLVRPLIRPGAQWGRVVSVGSSEAKRNCLLFLFFSVPWNNKEPKTFLAVSYKPKAIRTRKWQSFFWTHIQAVSWYLFIAILFCLLVEEKNVWLRVSQWLQVEQVGEEVTKLYFSH